MNKAWQQASDQANALTLPETLWLRPQVQGITTDGPISKDLDDAIYIATLSQYQRATGAIASIHIADVAELVTMGSPLDKVALARTQTRYLKRGNVPMLPHALSEDKLSLVKGQPRPTITIQVNVNPLGEIQTTDIFESWIVNAKRFSYEQTDRVCQRPSHSFHELLQRCPTPLDRVVLAVIRRIVNQLHFQPGRLAELSHAFYKLGSIAPHRRATVQVNR